jgi:hypothetical protein
MAVGPGDFVEARRRLDAKPQKVGEKLTSLRDEELEVLRSLDPERRLL